MPNPLFQTKALIVGGRRERFPGGDCNTLLVRTVGGNSRTFEIAVSDDDWERIAHIKSMLTLTLTVDPPP